MTIMLCRVVVPNHMSTFVLCVAARAAAPNASYFVWLHPRCGSRAAAPSAS